jgi:hypothetical protein
MSLPPRRPANKNDSGELHALGKGRCSDQLRLALQRKCKERGYPLTIRMLEVANSIAPAFARKRFIPRIRA